MNYVRMPQVQDIIRKALREDIGARDITTELIIPKDKLIKAVIIAKENCVTCGLGIAAEVFKIQDKNIKFKPLVLDGQKIKKGKIIAHIFGRAQSILTAERVALNFLSLLCGVATKTRAYVDKVKPYKVRILDTRKTIPGLRELEKYAVRRGGGYNHRMRLDEMALIKDNHLKIINPKSEIRNPKQIPNPKSQIPNLELLIARMKERNPKIKIEIEVRNLREFKEALEARLDIIMLDNMSIKDMEKAVHLRNSLSTKGSRLSPRLEASGGITIKNIKKVASCGVDMISVGELTHSVNSADISLEIL